MEHSADSIHIRLVDLTLFHENKNMMAVFVQNANQSLCISLTVLKLVGFWPPHYLSGHKYILYKLYFFLTFMFFLGTFLVVQTVDLFMIWGNIPLMTGTAFVLFTNLAQAAKIFTIFFRRKTIEAIIDHADEALRAEENQEAKKIVRECDLETKWQQIFYICLTTVTVAGWAGSAESNQLPLRAWYPYDTRKSPAYEITYFHQIGALFIAAYLNVSKDTLVTTLIAQCRCQLTLLGLSLRTLSQDLKIPNESLLTPDQEQIIIVRLRHCIERHQSALEAGVQLQNCFSAPVFAQFTVSLVIICVTAFQLTSQTGNPVRLLSMGTYLFNMMFQVFLYCYQGDKLTEESTKVADAVYQAPWYTFPVPVKKSILILMKRCRHVARLTAGGFTTLSLTSFMAIMKASYSFFTVLQQVNENNN